MDKGREIEDEGSSEYDVSLLQRESVQREFHPLGGQVELQPLLQSFQHLT